MDDYTQLMQDLASYYISQGKRANAHYLAQAHLSILGAIVMNGESYSGEKELLMKQIEVRAAKGREYREWREVAA